MSREMMNEDDVLESLRLKGIDRIKDVKIGYIETDGSISAITYDRDILLKRQAAAQAEDTKKKL